MLKKSALFFIRILFIWCLSFCVFAEVPLDDLLPPEQAFSPQISNSEQGLKIAFSIADGYYLYQSRIQIQTTPDGILGMPVLSQGESKRDAFFGLQTVYHSSAQIDIPYLEPADAHIYELTLVYQGCAEVGVCYPPAKTTFKINGNGVFKPANPAPSSSDAFIMHAPDEHRFDLKRHDLLTSIVTFFFAGIALSFTACMYPLLPVISSIIVGHQENMSKKRAFILALIYVQGLAITYTLVGIIAGLTGSLLTVWFQQPWVIFSAAFILILFALAMFDILSIQMPTTLQTFFSGQSQKLSGGKILSVLGMGALSALIVGPCIAPPLALSLGYIGRTGDAVLGGIALYSLAIGMGIPLLIVATFGGHILPRAGVWMHTIKHIFGFLMLIMAIYLISPYTSVWLSISLYTAISIAIIFMLVKNLHKLQRPWQKLSIMLLSTFFVLNTLYFIGTSISHTSSFLHKFLGLHFEVKNQFPRYQNVKELELAIAEAQRQHPDKPVIVDFYADWCISCKRMQSETFSQPEVVQEVSEAFQLIQVNVSANTSEHQALLKKYKLFGPPALFILKADGTRSKPLVGFADAATFLEWLNTNKYPDLLKETNTLPLPKPAANHSQLIP